MPVYLPTAVLGNARTLVTHGMSGEIMGWFYPSKDHAQNIHQCMPCVYVGEPHHGVLHWTWSDLFQRHQEYSGDANVLECVLTSPALGLALTIIDLIPDDE